ncbi:MAG: trypsin-like peptidase domain-containing protein [Lachnospiraceae bacterium]|nr:trypsin-like peptidase domain-containing protein [Lachnospiraceae bacterium]
MKTERMKRIFQAIILSSVTGALLLSAFCWRTKEQPINKPDHMQFDEEIQEDAFELSEVLGSCVRIQAEGHHGSGSIYQLLEDEIIIVTNWHVLQYWNEDSYVTFSNGAVGGGKVIAASEQADIGILSIRTAFLMAEELEGLYAVNESERTLTRGDTLYMVDIASDVWQPKVFEGQVLDPLRYLDEFGMEMLYGESLFKPGMSGCGVFDGEGNYVGMLTAGTDQNEIAAVPLDIVRLCKTWIW